MKKIVTDEEELHAVDEHAQLKALAVAALKDAFASECPCDAAEALIHFTSAIWFIPAAHVNGTAIFKHPALRHLAEVTVEVLGEEDAHIILGEFTTVAYQQGLKDLKDYMIQQMKEVLDAALKGDPTGADLAIDLEPPSEQVPPTYRGSNE